MTIESRTIVGGAAAFALVGAVMWGSAMLLTSPPAEQISRGTVEIAPTDEKAWMVDVQDVGPVSQQNRTAATR
jgi:hypothetical protein